MICTPAKYYLCHQIKKNEMGMGMYGTKRRCRRVLVGETEGKRPLGRPEYRWEENINMIFKMSDG